MLGPLISSSKPAAKCTFSAIAHPTPLLRSANAGLLPLSVNHRVRGLVGLNAAVDESEELVDKRTEGQEAMIQRLSNIADANERQAALKEVYHLIHNDAMQELARNLQAGSENAAAWQALLLDIQALTESRSGCPSRRAAAHPMHKEAAGLFTVFCPATVASLTGWGCAGRMQHGAGQRCADGAAGLRRDQHPRSQNYAGTTHPHVI